MLYHAEESPVGVPGTVGAWFFYFSIAKGARIMGEGFGINRSTGRGNEPQIICLFVGRRQQLAQVEHGLQDVMKGQPRVMVVQGEAGMGKTRFVQEAQTLATRLGLQVCAGRCHENLSLPYFPFVDSLLASLDQRIEDVEPPLDTDMDVIRRLLHHDSLPPSEVISSAPHPEQADQDTIRVLLAVSHATIALAQDRPLLLVVDDLHWADDPSLDLFAHLVFTTAEMTAQDFVPLFILGTHRPVAPGTRLSRFLVRFRREEIYQSLDLPSLDDADTYALLQGLGIRHPSYQLLNMLCEATRGNPLFLQAAVHHLEQQNALQECGGYVITTTSTPDEVRIPEHMTAFFASRIQALSADCKRILTFAALLGPSFSLQLLPIMSSVNEAGVLDAIEEGIQQGVLLDEGQTWQFAHPVLRHAFYREYSAARRQRMHWQVAQTLAQLHAENLEAHARQVVRHLIGAGPLADAQAVMTYARSAGDQANVACAWGEAARYYEVALKAAAALTSADQAALHAQAGLAHQRNSDVGPCLDHYDKAIALYRRLDDVPGLARVLRHKTHLACTLAAMSDDTPIDLQPLEAALHALGERDLGLQGAIMTTIAEASGIAQQPHNAAAMAQAAFAIGQRLGKPRLCAQARHALARTLARQGRLQEACTSWQQALGDARQANDLWLQGMSLSHMALALTRQGRLGFVQPAAQQAQTVTRTTQDWHHYSVALSCLATLHLIRGDFTGAEQQAQHCLRLLPRSHDTSGASQALWALICVHTLRGAWTAAEAVLDRQQESGRIFDESGPPMQYAGRVWRQLLRGYAGKPLDMTITTLVGEATPTAEGDRYPLPLCCAVAEIGDLMASPKTIAHVEPTLLQATEQGIRFTSGWVFCVPRLMGVAATLNRQWDQAEQYYQDAIDVAAGVNAKPELGRTYLDYGRMLAAKGGMHNQERASTYLEQARGIFDALGMQPFTQRAVQLAERLQFQLVPEPPDFSPLAPIYDESLGAHAVATLHRVAQKLTGFLA